MASSVVLFRNEGLRPTATGGQTSTVGEPSLAANGANVFFTGNWYAARSADDAATWQFVDPFTTLPRVNGGFCCDQTVIHIPGRDFTVWLLQYVARDNTNTLRLAVHRGPGLANSGWVFWDLHPVNVDSAWEGQWFDYNHAALSDNFLYVGTNVFSIDPETFTRSVIFRFPLDGLSEDGSFTFEFFESTSNFSLRCAQGATDTMYIASHNDLTQMRIFSWPESAASATSVNVDVSAWRDGSYSAPGPDGRNWLRRADARITGAWVAGGEIGVMWTANRMPPERPLPYVRVVRIDEPTKDVIAEPDIWNNNFAFGYPDAYPNANGDVGVTLFRGGGPHHPGHVVGFWDRGANGWRLRVARNSSDGPSDTKWGDYVTCRRHAPRTDTWVAAGFTLQGGGTRQDIEPRYVHFGRVDT